MATRRLLLHCVLALNELSPFDEFKMAEAADDTYSNLSIKQQKYHSECQQVSFLKPDDLVDIERVFQK